ncbi:unnamed protein product [Brassica oleracea]
MVMGALSLDEIRKAQRADGPARILAIGSATLQTKCSKQSIQTTTST